MVVVIVLAVLGFMAAAYGVAIMALGSGTWFFAFWYVVAAVLLGCAYAVHAGAWAALPLAGRRAVEALACVLLAMVVITQACVASGFSQRGEDDLDCIIVLGAQVHEWGPSMVTRYRLDAACDYLARNLRTRCIVTGGQGFNEPAPEADIMADYLVQRGVDPARITRERESQNTAQNIANCKELVDAGAERIGIITNDFHVFRAMALARKAGYAHACGIAAYSNPLYLPNNAIRESFSIVKDFCAGNI